MSAGDDLVARLSREIADVEHFGDGETWESSTKLLREAAAQITRLREENANERHALIAEGRKWQERAESAECGLDEARALLLAIRSREQKTQTNYWHDAIDGFLSRWDHT